MKRIAFIPLKYFIFVRKEIRVLAKRYIGGIHK